MFGWSTSPVELARPNEVDRGLVHAPEVGVVVASTSLMHDGPPQQGHRRDELGVRHQRLVRDVLRVREVTVQRTSRAGNGSRPGLEASRA